MGCFILLLLYLIDMQGTERSGLVLPALLQSIRLCGLIRRFGLRSFFLGTWN